MIPVLLWHCMELSVTPTIIHILNLLTVHQAVPLRPKGNHNQSCLRVFFFFLITVTLVSLYLL